MGSTDVPAGDTVPGGAFRSSTGRNVNVSMGVVLAGRAANRAISLNTAQATRFCPWAQQSVENFPGCVASHWVAACYAMGVKHTTPTPPPERRDLPGRPLPIREPSGDRLLFVNSGPGYVR
jgi:hypothetical protein